MFVLNGKLKACLILKTGLLGRCDVADGFQMEVAVLCRDKRLGVYADGASIDCMKLILILCQNKNLA